MVKFSHMIFYVKDVLNTISFYERAFDIKVKFIHESNQYAELNTGETSIAFASELLGKANLPEGFSTHNVKNPPFACEIVFTVDNVKDQYEKSIKEGGLSVMPPNEKPWGQIVAYVRDPNGILIEIASQMK